MSTFGQWIDNVPTVWKVVGVLVTVFGAGAATSQVVSGQLSLPERVSSLERSNREMALQVCLLRVEIRREPNTDRCAGLR